MGSKWCSFREQGLAVALRVKAEVTHRQNETRAAITKWGRCRRPGFLWPIFQFPACNLQNRKPGVTEYENCRTTCSGPEQRHTQTARTTKTLAKKVNVWVLVQKCLGRNNPSV